MYQSGCLESSCSFYIDGLTITHTSPNPALKEIVAKKDGAPCKQRSMGFFCHQEVRYWEVAAF
jgi:hypothetical protein